MNKIKEFLEDLFTNKINFSDIVNDLTTGGTTVPLSAEQGKTLEDTKVADTGDTNYMKIERDASITLADGASITIDSGIFTELFISTTGNSGALCQLFYPFSTIIVEQAPGTKFSATDADAKIRIYKSANSTTTTIKNSSGASVSLYLLNIGT